MCIFKQQSLLASMQFSFKRPQTSKSVSAFYRDKQKSASLPKAPEPTHTHLEEPSEFNKKWKQAAEKINRQMVIHRALHVNSEPFRLLTKMGGQVYSSQPKMNESNSKNRIRISSKEKRTKDHSKEMPSLREMNDQTGKLLQAPITESKLKRKKRNENFRVGLQQQLKTTNIFYESPVVKIGYNMQFQAYLRFQHISQIRPDHGGNICRNSMIFFLKDAPFSPNIISQKNTEVPISLSLFPQFFDSKLSISNIKRERYFERMLHWMNGTYDPERMAMMPHFSKFTPFDQTKYNEVAESLLCSNQQNYKAEWAENILKRLKFKLNEQQVRAALTEQWQFFNKANAMITLDYVLKNAQMAKKLKISPYLATRIITSRRVLYHGGYSKSLYSSWSNYVENSRKRLMPRLKCYTSITQSIYGWYCNFQQIQLYQSDFSTLLNESLSVELFHKIQLAKIQFCTDALQQIWFRGMLCLLHYQRYLVTWEGQYDQIGNYRHLLEQYVAEARHRTHEMKSTEEIEAFYLNFYENFMSSLRKDRHISNLEELMPAQKGQSPNLSNLKILLHIQFGKTIQRSFLALKDQILNYNKPLLRLHLIIDRQTFKFLEQQEDIINVFADIIKKIFGTKIEGYALACKFQADDNEENNIRKFSQKNNFSQGMKPQSSNIREYPQIYETGERNSLQEERQLNISYKTEFIFEESIRGIINHMRMYYKECYPVLGEYEMYLPFIKLTTTQKIFSEEQGSIQQSFLKNLKVVSRYKESISHLQKIVKINIFQVDCSAPIRSLEERIREIQYIIQQNYINIIHEKIESVDSQLNSLKISAHNIGLTAIDIEETQEKLIGIQHNLKMLQTKTKKIAQMVLFCLDNKRKIDTVVTCFCQLINKKQQLHRDIENLFSTLQSKRPEVEAEGQQQLERLLKAIDEGLQKGCTVQTTCFEFVNLPQYITSIEKLLQSYQNLSIDISKHFQHSKIKTLLPVQEKIQQFKRQFQRFSLIIQYWKQFHSFQSFFKEISKAEIRKIDFQEFSSQTQNSQSVIDKMQKTEKQWWEKDKIGWKPIIHKMHQYYSKKFKTDVENCAQLKPLLQILTNKKIRDRHWQLYGLENFRHIIFRELMKLDMSQQQSKLKKMDEDVNFEYEIYLAYEQIEKKIKGHKLIIVDLNDSDVLQLQNMNKCVEFLRNVEIDIKLLMQKDVGDYYDGQLHQLLILAQNTVIKIEEWRNIQERYIRFIKFHMINDEYEHTLFSALIELHRKLIKSYDIDNSVAFISKNIVMDSYLAQISEELKELEQRVTRYLSSLRIEYPRLFLLTDQELFDFMSSGANIQKYLRKCFPQIMNFGIKQGSIERIGEKRQLIFAEPFYIQEMIGRVNSWVSSLDDLIKCRLKQFFKTNQLLTEGKSIVELEINFYEKYPTQLSILDEQILFTEQISEAVATASLRPFLQQIENKIEYHIKEKKDTFMLLLFLVFREQINALMQEDDLHSQSFEWLKYPRFYKKGQLDIRVAFIHQENTYGFNYLQKAELIHTDNVFMGNCLIGPSGSGKTSFARYLAYLCGQQLLIFDPRSINHFQQSISSLVNYIRVNAFTGNWLLLQRIDLLGESQLKLIAECLSTVQESLKQQSNKLTLSGLTTSLNKSSRVLMTICSLTGKELPGRLCVLIRPIWIIAPNQRFLLQLYLQSKRVNNIEVGKILKFCSWLENHREVSIEILNWIRDQQDPEIFSSAAFFQKACDYGLFKGEGQFLLESLKKEDDKMNGVAQQANPISLYDHIAAHNHIVLYGERSSGKTCDVLETLTQQTKYLIINAYNYQRNDDLFDLVSQIKNLQGFTHIIFKHGLQFYPLMREHLSKFKVIFIENTLAELQLGMVFDLQMINYHKLTANSPHHDNTIQHFIGKIFKEDHKQHQKAFTKNTLFCKIIDKIRQSLCERVNTNQLSLNFCKILKLMLDEEYQFNNAFIFAIIWSFGFSMEDKKIQEILKTVISAQQQIQKTKFQKINIDNTSMLRVNTIIRKIEEDFGVLVRDIFANRLICLSELIPTRKGSFVSSIDSGTILKSYQDIQLIGDYVVNMKSNFIYNLSLIRRHFDSTISIDGRDWLTTILKASNPTQQNCKWYNFGSKSTSQVFCDIFKGSKRNGVFYSFTQNVRITIDDVHLCNLSTLNSLRDLSDYNFAIFLQDNQVKIYQTSRCQFTFGGKFNHQAFEKTLRILIEELTISNIFNEYVQSYCQKFLHIDRSIFSLLNLANTINRTFKDRQQLYFWYKNPLLLLQAAKATNLTEFTQGYIDYLKEILPQEKGYLNQQRSLLELSRNSTDSQDDPQVINTTRKFIKFYNESQLIDELVADHEVLQEIQANQIQSIFFEKFIKNYFTRDILNYVLKIAKFLKDQHLVLLGDNYSHTDKILRYACKIETRKLTSLRSRVKPIPREVFTMDLEHCKEAEIEELQSIIKLQVASKYDGLDVRFVLTANLHSSKLKYLYLKYPFLKSHFLNLVLQQKPKEHAESLSDIQSSKYIGETTSNDTLQKLQKMAQTNNFADQLKEQLVKVLQRYKKQEFLNLQFYRKVSSEMMINIDHINTNLINIPAIINTLSQRENILTNNKNKNVMQCQELGLRLDKWEDKRHTFTELFNFKSEKEVENLNRLNQSCGPLFVKMDKIEKKIEAIEAVEFARLKNNLKNNENITLVQPLHNMLALLNQKGDTNAKDKLNQFIANLFAGPSSLASLLRNIRHRQVYDKQIIEEEDHPNHLISTGMTQPRLKFILSRAEELNDNAKKYEKVSLIYKSISSWLMHFINISTHLKQYLDLQEEVDTHLTSQISKFNAKYGENADINYQKQNLHVFITQSQNRIVQIRQSIDKMTHQNKTADLDQKKIFRLKKFFNQREERLQKISKLLVQSQYMKKVSAGVSLYFKNLDHISFYRALVKTTLNQYLTERMLDPDLLFGIFTSKVDLFRLRERLQAQNINFQQLQILNNLSQKKDKCLKLVEDRNNIIKSKLIDAVEVKGYHIQKFQQIDYKGILRFMDGKLAENSKLLILHENIHYLEVARRDNEGLFDEFLEESLSLIKERNAEVIYLTNSLPKVSSKLYSSVDFGKVTITHQRFMTDLSDIFNVATHKQALKTSKPNKRRGDFQTVVMQKNTLTKQLMSSIQNLARALTSNPSIFDQHSSQQVQSQQIFSQNLQNQLINLISLQQQEQHLKREATNFTYLSESIRNLIEHQLKRYLSLYEFTDSFNNKTNNQFFAGKEFYREWINLLKNLREERISWFNRQEYRTVISQIVVKNQGEEKQKEEVKPKGEESQAVQVNQAINPIFHKNNQDVFICLVEKILKGTTWLQKSFLFQYSLGVCLIQGFETYMHPQMLEDILNMRVVSKEQINDQCLKVLKFIDADQYYRGYEIRFDKLTSEFIESLSGNINPLSPGSQVSVIMYYFLLSKFNQYDLKIQEFLVKFSESSQKGASALNHRYQFIKTLKNLKLMSQYMLKLTPPLNLSINLDTRGEREKLITIIEEEKYLLNDLVQLLKVKSLSKKRELECILINMQRKEELIDVLKHHYRSSKQWILLANFSIINRTEVRQLLEQIIFQLSKLPSNPFFRIFIVLNKEQQGEDSLYYNKYEINRVKGCHNLTDMQYYQSINEIAMQSLFDGRARQLIQQLIHTTIKDEDDYYIAENRLEDLKSIFSKLMRKHRFLMDQDFKLYYKNLVQELIKLGYLKKDHNQRNFYKYIANYFVLVPGINADVVRKEIQDQRALFRKGISNTILFQNNRTEQSLEQSVAIERINTQKIDEYFKNINSEFAEVIRKEIVVNNLIEADQQFISLLKNEKRTSRAALQQATRVCFVKNGLTSVTENVNWVTVAALRKLPLLRLLNNLKLRQICINKKVEINSNAQFWIFLTAFQNKQIKEFSKHLNSDRNQQESRYSNGIGLFGNFINTKDYATKMKIVLIQVETYQQLPISQQEIIRVMTENSKIQAKFLLAIRKANPQKITQVNVQHIEIEKMLKRCSLVLQIGGELTLEIALK